MEERGNGECVAKRYKVLNGCENDGRRVGFVRSERMRVRGQQQQQHCTTIIYMCVYVLEQVVNKQNKLQRNTSQRSD